MKNFDIYKRICAYDFAIYEMVLYLDTHPGCPRGLEKLSRLRKERTVLINEYEKRYGKYVKTHDDVPTDGHWSWIDGPWPWENEANE